MLVFGSGPKAQVRIGGLPFFPSVSLIFILASLISVVMLTAKICLFSEMILI